MAACGKHFPGHGDTDLDSHKALPVVEHERGRLEEVELPPFRAAIDAEVAALDDGARAVFRRWTSRRRPRCRTPS